jgi:UDP-glucose 4-epimerase
LKILLTGGAGYIGSHTAVVLASAGHSVVLFDNFCNSSKSVTTRINQIINQLLTCIEGDIRDEELLIKTMRDFQIEAVIHFAGLKAVGESTQEPLRYFNNNVAGSISLFEAMKQASVKTIVFSSSATVYGQPQYLPYDEIHPLNPINPYGRTKLQVEEILQDFAKSDPSMRIALLRYFNPVGSHESGLIGEDPISIPNNLMPYIARVAAGVLPQLNIFGNDYDTRDGTGERDYIHVMDLAEGHLAALNYLSLQSGCNIFNLGSGNSVSVLELVREFEVVSQSTIPYSVTNRRVGDLASCFASVSKAKSLLGWSAKRDLSDMCKTSWNWQKYRGTLND